MTLFALTSMAEARILRFPLTPDLSAEVDECFRHQEAKFLLGINETIPFDGRYRPEVDEMLEIKDYVDVDGLAAAIANPLPIDQFDPNLHSLEKVKAIFSGSAENGSTKVLIQLFESRRVFTSKGGLAMWFSQNTFQKMGNAGLTLDTKLLAILQDGVLKFQSFHYLRRVLEMGEYFNEATADDLKKFVDHPAFSRGDVHRLDKSNTVVRKKIALILQSGVLDNFTPVQLVDAAIAFKVDMKLDDDGKIILPEGAPELRRILRFLDEDYYESALTQTRFLSNSKRVAD